MQNNIGDINNAQNMTRGKFGSQSQANNSSPKGGF
jgi:hypothetical protein